LEEKTERLVKESEEIAEEIERICKERI